MTRARTALATAAAIAALVAAPPAALQAQVVRGTIAAGSPQRPLSGAVVTGRDSAGTVVTRTLSDSIGAFRLDARRGVTTLRITRIGYTPLELPLARFTGVATMQPIGVALSAVRVTGRAMCPDAAGREQVVQVWEQAREALLAAVVAREARPANASLFLYERTLDAGGRRVLSETRRTRSVHTSRPFVAVASASTFATLGYVRAHGGEQVFFAPDADVLLDPTFADSHCFAVVRDGERPGFLGLQFTPASERTDVVDVRGTLWLRHDDPQIENVEFSYTNLTGASSSRQAGGYLEFATLGNGVTMLSRWFIRMPRVVVRAREGTFTSGTGIGSDGPRVTGVHETGGVVMTATWADGSSFAPVVARITGVVRRQPGDAPVGGATIELEGTGTSTTSDSLGRFEMSAPLSGRYTVTATDTMLPSTLPERVATAEVVVTEGRDTPMRLELPGDAAVAAALCESADGGVRRTRGRREGSTLLGKVTVPGGSPAGMHAVANWLAHVTIGSGVVHAAETTVSLELDSTGTFVLCDVVHGRPVRLSARRGDALLVDTALTLPERAALVRVALTADLASQVRLAQQLKPVEVAADRSSTSSRMRAFEERKRSGAGHFIDEAAMRRSDAPIAVLIPRHVSGMRVLFIDAKTHLALARGSAPRGLAGQDASSPNLATPERKPCWVDIYIDGIRQAGDVPGEPVDITQLSTHTLAAAEFYPGGASIPPEFNRAANNCGVLLLWSRER